MTTHISWRPRPELSYVWCDTTPDGKVTVTFSGYDGFNMTPESAEHLAADLLEKAAQARKLTPET